MTEIKKYPKPLIAIHWLTVLLFVFVFVRGKMLEDYDFNETNMDKYRMHAIPGILILILTVIRIFVKNRYKNSLPVAITYYNNTHKIMVNLVIKLIYILLILTPLVGFVMIFQTGAMDYDFGGAFPTDAHFNDTLEVLHKGFMMSLLILIVIHIVGVVLYKFKTGENLVKRMCVFLK